MIKKNILNKYAQAQLSVNPKYDQRAQKIIQKAKNYNVDMFANEMLANELFHLKFPDTLDHDFIKSLLDIYATCDSAIEEAQSSL